MIERNYRPVEFMDSDNRSRWEFSRRDAPWNDRVDQDQPRRSGWVTLYQQKAALYDI
jgi:hypothetical protein